MLIRRQFNFASLNNMDVPRCAHCHSVDVAYACSACKSTKYCSVACQTENFVLHRHACVAIERFAREHDARRKGETKTKMFSLDVCRFMKADVVDIEEAMVFLSLINGDRTVRSCEYGDEFPSYKIVCVCHSHPLVACALEFQVSSISKHVTMCLHFFREDGTSTMRLVNPRTTWPLCLARHSEAEASGSSTAHDRAVVMMYPEEWSTAIQQAVSCALNNALSSADTTCIVDMANVATSHATRAVWDTVHTHVLRALVDQTK